MSAVIAITNQKGGVGKTTTSCALLAGLHQRGCRVLGVDLTPRGAWGSAWAWILITAPPFMTL